MTKKDDNFLKVILEQRQKMIHLIEAIDLTIQYFKEFEVIDVLPRRQKIDRHKVQEQVCNYFSQNPGKEIRMLEIVRHLSTLDIGEIKLTRLHIMPVIQRLIINGKIERFGKRISTVYKLKAT